MKTLATGILVLLGLGIVQAAEARHEHGQTAHGQSHHKQGYSKHDGHKYDDQRFYDSRKASKRDRRYNRNKHRDSRYANDRMRLYIPVSIWGSEKVKLDRLVARYHNINPRHFELKRVVLHQYGHRDAIANLFVGRHGTGPVYLHGGANKIRAPRSNGRWTLRTRRAQLEGITVVIEPKHDYARHHSDREHSRRDNRYGYKRDNRLAYRF